MKYLIFILLLTACGKEAPQQPSAALGSPGNPIVLSTAPLPPPADDSCPDNHVCDLWGCYCAKASQ